MELAASGFSEQEVPSAHDTSNKLDAREFLAWRFTRGRERDDLPVTDGGLGMSGDKDYSKTAREHLSARCRTQPPGLSKRMGWLVRFPLWPVVPQGAQPRRGRGPWL